MGQKVISLVVLAGLLFIVEIGDITTILWSLGFPDLSESLSKGGFTVGI